MDEYQVRCGIWSENGKYSATVMSATGRVRVLGRNYENALSAQTAHDTECVGMCFILNAG